jgi:hypothetical protein
MENYNIHYCLYCGHEINKRSFILSDSGEDSRSCGSKPKSHEVNKSKGEKIKNNDPFITTKRSFESNQISFLNKLELNENEQLKINNFIVDIWKSKSKNNIIPSLFSSFYVGDIGTKKIRFISNKYEILHKDFYQCEIIDPLQSITIDHLSLDLINIDEDEYIKLFLKLTYLTKLNISLLISKEHFKLNLKKENLFEKSKISYIYIYSIYLNWFGTKTIIKK